MALISIVIPTYRDSDRLLKGLESIARQVKPEMDLEVIIANNDPEDPLAALDDFPIPLKIVNEPLPGSYSARNQAIQHSTGDFFLFTDSDCIPSDDWISKAIAAISTMTFDILAGRVEVFSFSGSKFGKFDKAFAFPNQEYVEKEGFGVTANLLVRKGVVDKIGGFQSGLLTGGDREFCNRAIQSGFSVRYYKDLMVYHPARETWNEMRVKAKRFGGRIPQDSNKILVFLKLIGKFRIRIQDIQTVSAVPNPVSEKGEFLWIIARLRWVEAMESMKVFFGKEPGRL